MPKAGRRDRAALSALARGMQERSTLRVTLREDLHERLAATSSLNLPLERFLPDVRAVAIIEDSASPKLPKAERKLWADAQRRSDEEAALARMDGLINAASEADVQLNRGKLSLRIDEQEVARLFVSEAEAPLVEGQWRAVALDFAPTGKGDARRLVDRLRHVATAADPATTDQIVAIGGKLAELDSVLRDDEAQLHELTCHLFNLTDEERRLVETGRA